MRVAVTGAMGLIGRAVVKSLSCDDISLTCLSRSEVPETTDGVRWLRGDLNNQEIAEELVAGQNIVIHLAHDSTPLTTSMNLISDVQRSLFPSLRLIQAIAASGNKPHVIYLSSGGALYGCTAGNDSTPFREIDACAPVMSYGIQKITTERYLHNAAENNILRATILRVSNAYGELLPSERMQGLIGTSISRVLQGQPLRLIGDPQNVRDFVHINDIVIALRKTLQLTSDFEIINIGSGEGHSVFEVLKIISQIAGCKAPMLSEEVAGSKLLPNWCVLDVSKARNLLGWEAHITLNDGIAAMFAKARAHF